MTLRKRLMVAALCAPLVFLGSCSSNESDDSEKASTEANEAEDVGESTGSAPVRIGEPSNSDGIELTVQEVWSSPTVTLDGETIDAPENLQYVYVRTTGKNNTEDSIDPCDNIIDATVTDAQGESFEVIDRLYDYKDNPGCLDNIDPGYPFNKTYIYLVPKAADIKLFEYFEVDQSLLADEDAPVATVKIAPVEEKD